MPVFKVGVGRAWRVATCGTNSTPSTEVLEQPALACVKSEYSTDNHDRLFPPALAPALLTPLSFDVQLLHVLRCCYGEAWRSAESSCRDRFHCAGRHP